jgi:hypothetical protein
MEHPNGNDASLAVNMGRVPADNHAATASMSSPPSSTAAMTLVCVTR